MLAHNSNTAVLPIPEFPHKLYIVPRFLINPSKHEVKPTT